MEIREEILKKLGRICCGDEGSSDYLSLSKLETLFNII